MSPKGDSSTNSKAIRYRADVDGLRAIAVLSVVFFHLKQTTLPGGYLGVDMFFLLSGFLITSIIWSEIQDIEFSIYRFYNRRIRRILPALLLVLILTTVASTILLLPVDLIGYSKSLLATLAFLANVYFWRDTDYFARAAEDKPLLHMWSLGVEEQFYILFPLILVFLARLWPRGTLHTIAMLTIGSLALNMLMLFVGGDSPAFFLLPTRAWELGLGAILALLPPPHTVLQSITANFVAAIGVLLVVVGILYPLQLFLIVPVAVPVVTGTALLVFAGQHDCPAVNRALRLPPLVFVGLISYSLYLWHWPIIVFCRYFLVCDLSTPEMAAALVIMTVGAIGSWRFVERPFRSKKMPIRTVLYAAGAGVVSLAAVAVPLLILEGLPGRLSDRVAAINEAVGNYYGCSISDYVIFGMSRACLMNLPSRNPADADIVLLGNSHAQMYAPVWASILIDRGLTGLLIPVNSCLPTVQANYTRYCNDVARRNLTGLANLPRARTVIVGLTWHQTDNLIDPSGLKVDNRDNAALVAALDDLIDQIHRIGKKVILIGPIAEPGWDVPSIISRQLAFGHPCDRPIFLLKSEFTQRFEASFRHFEARGDISFVRVDRVQCSEDRCFYLLDGRSLFADGNHIAAAELWRFRTLFEASLPLH
jgi:peptidoglycan/LPS O-acetylase OafA/YrhL